LVLQLFSSETQVQIVSWKQAQVLSLMFTSIPSLQKLSFAFGLCWTVGFYQVTTSGFFTAPAGEVSLPQRGTKMPGLSFLSSCPPRMVEEELQAARVARQQLVAAGARRRSQLDRTLRETAEANAVAERIRADIDNASIGQIYVRTERSIASVEAASAVAASLLKSELEGVEAAAAAAAREDEERTRQGLKLNFVSQPQMQGQLRQ
jgi:hypothetical protein